jgi:preprotein translocase subunit SecD
MRLGLDLQGGTYLVMEADTSSLDDPSSVDIDQSMEAAVNIIERRINALGVAESEVSRQGSSRIAVQIPGIDPEQARDLVGRTAQLEFKEPKYDEQGNYLIDQPDGNVAHIAPHELPPGNLGQIQWEPARAAGPDGVERPLTGQYLKPNAFVDVQTVGVPRVRFEFNSDGAVMFEKITQRLLNKPLGIFLDGELVSAPTVNAVISDSGVIEGTGNLQEARLLVAQLNAGALPVPLEVVQQQGVDATLGADSVLKSVVAGEVALLIVMAFMI